jgi:hypothetical protein
MRWAAYVAGMGKKAKTHNVLAWNPERQKITWRI